MAEIRNTLTIKEFNDVARGDSMTNVCPKRVAESVVPVIDINPKHARISDVVGSANFNATSATLVGVRTGYDFFITALHLCVIKNVASTSTATQITATINGSAINILAIPELTLTAQSQNTDINFTCPLKIDRGTTITASHQGAHATDINGYANVYGFYEEIVK